MSPELKFAWRHVWREPRFTVLAVVSLAVAIGVNAAIFSVVNGFLLRPTVARDPERYVGLFQTTRDAARAFQPFSYAEFETLRADRTAFVDVSAVYYSQVALGESADARRAFAFLVSENFFRLAGAAPAAGRLFTPEECAPDSGSDAVIASHRLWLAAGGRPDFVGSTLTINGRSRTVVGVAPEGFSGASPLLAPEVWLPLGAFADFAPAFGVTRARADLAAPDNRALALFARLTPTVTRDTAAPLLDVLARHLGPLSTALGEVAARELLAARPLGIAPSPARDSAFAPITALSLGLSALVLAVACLNLSNLLLARSSTRAPEIATRMALGASRARIIRQLLLEGLIVGGLSGVAGLVLSTWLSATLARVLAARVSDFGFSVATSFAPDGHVLAFTVAASLLACVAFSLGPAWRASRRDLTTDLKGGSVGALAGAGRSRWAGRNLLLILQASLSLVLLFAAGLFLRSALESSAAPRGLSPQHRAVAEIDLALAGERGSASASRVLDALEDIRRAPGVVAAGLASLVPFANDVQIARVTTLTAPKDGAAVVAAFAAISDGYFDVVAPLVRGRDFSPDESAGRSGGNVCIIDEGLARRLFGAEDGLGESIALRGGPHDQVRGNFRVIGIVAAHSQDVADRQQPFARVFVPWARVDTPVWYLTARGTFGADTALALTVEKHLRSQHPELPLVSVKTMTRFWDANFSRWQADLGAAVFGFFGAIAAALAAVGIYGVTAYAMARRTREFGLRIALGARTRDIAWLVGAFATTQLGAALVVGMFGCFATGAALASFVPSVPRFDAWSLGGAMLVLLAAAVPALLIPARRATRIDPTVALRSE